MRFLSSVFLCLAVVMLSNQQYVLLSSAYSLSTSQQKSVLSTTRRTWITKAITSSTAAAIVTASTTTNSLPAFAATDEELQTFNDDVHGFSIQIPKDWVSSEQAMADRRKLLLWTDPKNPSTALFIAYTPVRDDFTSLGSFGSVDQVAAQTILPKSTLMDEKSDTSAKMLSAISTKQAYIFDYKQKVGTIQPETHYRTIFTLKQVTGNAGSTLVTITLQTPEAQYSNNVKNEFDTIINSYGKNV